MKKCLLERGWDVSLSNMDASGLNEEIRMLEYKLSEIGYPGNDPYKKMMVNACNSLICTCNAFLLSRSADGEPGNIRHRGQVFRHSLWQSRRDEYVNVKKVSSL